MGDDGDFFASIDYEDDEAFIESFEAVGVLADSLPELRGLPAPPGLPHAAAELRRRLVARDMDLRPVSRANGWSKRPPSDDRQLWIESLGALIAIKNDTGLSSEVESLLMTLDHADLLGAVVVAVRAGAGSSAGPSALVANIDACPEVDGEVDEDDRELTEAAFRPLVDVWQAAGALDDQQRLTELGRWGLPRALAWAWNGDFDSDPSE